MSSRSEDRRECGERRGKAKGFVQWKAGACGFAELFGDVDGNDGWSWEWKLLCFLFARNTTKR